MSTCSTKPYWSRTRHNWILSASGSILPVNPNYTFNPQTMPVGNYNDTVEGAPCPPDLATVNIFVDPPFRICTIKKFV